MTLTLFQSTPPVKAATLCACYCCGYAAISIHAAREGGDRIADYDTVELDKFQSTPPVKAATVNVRRTQKRRRISIHAAREGGDVMETRILTKNGISIHAAREGGDTPAF